jgi:hypothetical protein
VVDGQVLALSKVSQSPFLAMDEFDVFMDETNRTVGLQMLVEVRTDTLMSPALVVLFQILMCLGEEAVKARRVVSGDESRC